MISDLFKGLSCVLITFRSKKEGAVLNNQLEPDQADIKAIQSDWKQIGKDIERSIRAFEHDHQDLLNQQIAGDTHTRLLATENLAEQMEKEIDHILAELNNLKEFLNGKRNKQKDFEKSFSELSFSR